MAQADYNRIIPWPGLVCPDLATDFTHSTTAAATISTTSSIVALPITISESTTFDHIEAYLASGVSTDFRCRVVTENSSTGLPSTTLADGSSTATVSVSGAGWKTFDFTNFTLSAGRYWVLFDSTSTPSTALAIHYMPDAYANAQYLLTPCPMYWTGSAYAVMNAGTRALRVRVKSTDGWLFTMPCFPFPGASGLNPLVMDTAENPSCRGNRFVAPYSGTIIGASLSIGLYNSGASFDCVLANSGCTTELGRIENFYVHSASLRGAFVLEFPSAVSVTAGTSYDLYVTAGSLATSSTGPWISALDVSDDSGNVIQCLGVSPGDVIGMYVHQPVTEGGAGSVTTTANHVFPLVPIYGSITAGGGGGGGVPVAFST